MITDARALKPRSVPQDMAHRDGEIDHLAAALDPIASENVSIFGPSGAGKTTLAKYVLGRLERDRLEYRWAYHNCMSESSKAGALHSLVRDAGLGRDLRRNGTPTGVYVDRISERDEPMALVLDELEEYDLIEQDDEDDGRYRVLDADVSSSLNVDIPTPNRGCD
jgi:Cdc6-like AAA superfamily ATPase